jgi:hypothetical protein
VPLPVYSERKPILVGIGIWAVLFLVGLLIRGNLVEAGHGWWIWTALAGIGLGGVGFLYLVTRRPH